MQNSHSLRCIRSALRRAVLRFDQDGMWLDELFQRLYAGKAQECPSPEGLIGGLRNHAVSVFEDCEVSASKRAEDPTQPAKGRFLQALLHEARDP